MLIEDVPTACFVVIRSKAEHQVLVAWATQRGKTMTSVDAVHEEHYPAGVKPNGGCWTSCPYEEYGNYVEYADLKVPSVDTTDDITFNL